MAGGASAVETAPGCSAANGRRELKQDKTDALETLPSGFATIRERVCGVLESRSAGIDGIVTSAKNSGFWRRPAPPPNSPTHRFPYMRPISA